jgi:biopolymer transport protein ExbB
VKEAITIAESSGGLLGRVFAACLRRRAAGVHAMEDSIQEQLLHELPRLNRFLGGLAILAAVAPLLGLLGTVTGIIQTFGVIQAFGNANPGLMAGGISEALITTAAGLVIAIPILLVHSLLRGRVDRIVADAEMHAATLLNVVAHDGTPVAAPTLRTEAHVSTA